MVLLVIFLACCLAVTHEASGEQVAFSLAVGESVVVGSYTLRFLGVEGGYLAYDLYLGTSLVAHFPPTPLPPNTSKYVYQNISIVTTGVAPGGSAVTGTITIP
jgi:hypothetical protein